MRTLVKTITRKDFQIDFLKTGGPGGQHRNKVETAVRITHIDSGITVVAGDHKSQAQNKKAAFTRLVDKMEMWIRERYISKGEKLRNFSVVRTYKERRDEVKDARLPDVTFSYSNMLRRDGLNEVLIMLKGLEK